MVLVFILCFIAALISLLIIMLVLSTIRIEINHFEASNIEKKDMQKEYKIQISFIIFEKLKWLWININNQKIKRISRKINWQDINFKKVEQEFKLEDLKQLKKLQPKLIYLNLESKLGLEDVIVTSFVVATISSLISIILPHISKHGKENKYHYEIVPLYWNKNVYEIKFGRYN